jgi:hypothetical protein
LRWVHSLKGWSWLTCVHFLDHGPAEDAGQLGGQGRLGRLFRRRRSGLAWPRQLGTSRGCSKRRGKERARGGAAKELVDNAHAI